MSRSRSSNSTQFFVLAMASVVFILMLVLTALIWTNVKEKRRYAPTVEEPQAKVIPPPTPYRPQPIKPPLVQPSASVAVDDSDQEVQPSVEMEPPAPAVTLPILDESDADILQGVGEFGLSSSWLELIDKEEIARKFVRTVYNISQGKLVSKHRSIEAPNSPFQAIEIGGYDPSRYVIASANSNRYIKYLDLLESLNLDLLVTLYSRYLPLLEDAFAELGVPGGSFDNTMIEAIDNFLAAPSIANDDLVLVRPGIMYRFNDPKHEALPATHKLILRMGSNNAARFKVVLKSLRDKLAD